VTTFCCPLLCLPVRMSAVTSACDDVSLFAVMLDIRLADVIFGDTCMSAVALLRYFVCVVCL
jgi:hypothetical protein